MHSARIQSLIKRFHRQQKNDVGYVSYLHSHTTDRVFLATHEDVARIYDEFHRIPDKYAHFEAMFLTLFKIDDIEFALHFQLESVKDEHLRSNQRFRTHVGKFQRFFTSLLDMLSKGPSMSEQIVQVLREVGRQHCNVRSMSFTAEKWLVFKNLLIASFCKETNKSYSTWCRLISFIIFEIKDSYLEHIRRARSSSCPVLVESRVFRRSMYRKGSSDTKGVK